MPSSHPRQNRSRVAIIGGDGFGKTTALFLARFCEIQLFERALELFQEATLANHNRQHLGFTMALSYSILEILDMSTPQLQERFLPRDWGYDR
jgi:hypothetical protein